MGLMVKINGGETKRISQLVFYAWIEEKNKAQKGQGNCYFWTAKRKGQIKEGEVRE